MKPKSMTDQEWEAELMTQAEREHQKLRDHFAGMAMVEVLKFSYENATSSKGLSDELRECPRVAYELADLMMEARERP